MLDRLYPLELDQYSPSVPMDQYSDSVLTDQSSDSLPMDQSSDTVLMGQVRVISIDSVDPMDQESTPQVVGSNENTE